MDVGSLRMPPRRVGDALARQARAAGGGARTHAAVVEAVDGAEVVLSIEGRTTRRSVVGVSNQAVAVGDRVRAAKAGGRWFVDTTLTAHDPVPVPRADTSPPSGTRNGDQGSWYGEVNDHIKAIQDRYNDLHDALVALGLIIEEP